VGFPWFGGVRDADGHRHVELMLGPQDGAVIEIGPNVMVWETSGGRYAPVSEDDAGRFYWDVGSAV
jgi:hypothetical protein